MNNFETYGELLNLLNKGPTEEEREGFNKFLSKIKKELFNKPFFDKCQICNRQIKFCHSHTIPQFILKNISNQGHLYNQQILNDTPLLKATNGIRNTQTFESICGECDSKIFHNYETPENYSTLPTEQMLNEIALKCHFFSQYRFARDIKMNEYANKILCQKLAKKESRGPYSDLIKCYKLDKIYHTRQIKENLKAIQDNIFLYKIGFYLELDYVVPIAFQDNISLYFDLRNRKINTPFTKNINSMDYLYFCVYPFENKSVIFIFHKVNCKKYNNFLDDLKKMPIEEQLSIINYLIFLYSENIFISPKVPMPILNDIKLKTLSQLQPISITPKNISLKNREILKIKLYKENYNISKHKDCTNLLDKKFAII